MFGCPHTLSHAVNSVNDFIADHNSKVTKKHYLLKHLLYVGLRLSLEDCHFFPDTEEETKISPLRGSNIDIRLTDSKKERIRQFHYLSYSL